MRPRHADGSGDRRAFSWGEAPDRPADLAVRRANLRRVAILFKPYRWRLAAVLGLIFLSALLGIVSPFLIRDIFDEALPRNDDRLLTLLVLGLIAIAVVTGVLGVVQTWLSNVVGQRVMHDLRAAVYRHLQRLSLAFFTRTRTGEVQSRIANDIGGVERVVTSTATSIVSNVTSVLAVVVAMFLLDWRLALFSLALVPVFVLLTRKVGEQRRLITTDRQKTMADISTLVEESLSVSGILLGKTMGRSAELTGRFERESSELASLEVRQVMAGRWVMASIQMSFSIMPALVYWFAGQSFVGGVSLGTVVAFTTLQTRLFFPVGSLLSVQIDVQTSLALFDRVFEYLDLPVEIVEREEAVDLPQCRGDLAFEDVWFRYEPGAVARDADTQEGRHAPARSSETIGRAADGDGRAGWDGTWTLRDVSFQVPAGTTTAVVGETGSGKTTVGYLVARLYEVERGRVTIDGIDVRAATLSSLARTVGVVSQETYLFHASIKDNLRFAKPEASDEELEQAARAARIHDLIASLPDGYDTLVGERGYRFSGGEKQRIAIARTILRNPPVLVLDEATSALDAQTERAVQEALDRLARDRTTIAIAHRLSTIREADQILVLDGGQIVERGTHSELLALGGRYASLVSRDTDLGPIVQVPSEEPA
jgi:ATP-binding cassette, subfamily B, bacterial